jgi:hypothetical protein
MGGTPYSAHLATGFKKKKTGSKKAAWENMAACNNRGGSHTNRKQINCYLQVGRFACPLHSPLAGINYRHLHLSGNTQMVKGREPYIPILNAAYKRPPPSGDRCAHIASRPATQINHTHHFPLMYTFFPAHTLEQTCYLAHSLGWMEVPSPKDWKLQHRGPEPATAARDL